MTTKTLVSLQPVPAANIVAFANDVAEGRVAGITSIVRPRAASHAANPAALPTDPVLYVGYMPDDRCVGYLGVLPAVLECPEGPQKIGWFTAAYSTPEIRRTGTNDNSAATAFAHYGSIFATGASLEAEKFYRRSGFIERTCDQFVHIPLSRLTLATIGRRLIGRFGVKAPAPHAAVANTLRRKVAERGRGRVADSLPEEALALREPRIAPRFRRSESEVKWMLGQSWFPEDHQVSAKERDYYFHTQNKIVTFQCLILDDLSGRTRAAATLSLVREDGRSYVKVLDVFCKDSASHLDLVRSALAFALDHQAKSLYLDRRYITRTGVQGRWLALIARPAPIPYFFSTKNPAVLAAIPKIEFATTDCDMAFW